MFALIDIAWFAAGFAVCWFFREPVTDWYKKTEDRIGELNDKIQKLKAKL
jgi:hypothetical protein